MVVSPKLVSDNGAVTWGLSYHSPAEESHIDTTTPQEQVTSTVPQTSAYSHVYQENIGKSRPSRESYGHHHLPLMERHGNISTWRGTQKVEKLLQPKGCWSPVTDVKNVVDFLHGMLGMDFQKFSSFFPVVWLSAFGDIKFLQNALKNEILCG